VAIGSETNRRLFAGDDVCELDPMLADVVEARLPRQDGDVLSRFFQQTRIETADVARSVN